MGGDAPGPGGLVVAHDAARRGRRRRPAQAGRARGARSGPCWRPERPAPRVQVSGRGRRSPTRSRTCFERDRDRILHSTAFRRLAGKTQVFVFPADHQRTRLTHALEVAQVATAVARAVGLNVALTEAIALGHDCGHGPGGHASEGRLRRRVPRGGVTTTPPGVPTWCSPRST